MAGLPAGPRSKNSTSRLNFRNKNVEVEIHRSVYGDFDFDSTDNPQIENFNTKKFIFSLNAATARTLKLRVTMRFGSNVKQK